MKSKITTSNILSFLKTISIDAVSNRGKSNLPSFNIIASQNNIYPGFALELKKQLISGGLIVNYGTKIGWNPAFSKPTEQMAENLLKKVFEGRKQLIKNRALGKSDIKSDIKSELNLVSIKNLSDTLLVTELRERGYDVKCEKYVTI